MGNRLLVAVVLLSLFIATILRRICYNKTNVLRNMRTVILCGILLVNHEYAFSNIDYLARWVMFFIILSIIKRIGIYTKFYDDAEEMI